MSYVRSKMINGHGPYYYRVESVRHGDHVEQKYVAYLGKTAPAGMAAPITKEKDLGTTESQQDKQNRERFLASIAEVEALRKEQKERPKDTPKEPEPKKPEEPKKDSGTKEPDKDYDYYEGREYDLQGKPFDYATYQKLKESGNLRYVSREDLDMRDDDRGRPGWKLRVNPESAKIMRESGKSVGTKEQYATHAENQKKKQEEEKKKKEEFLNKAYGDR